MNSKQPMHSNENPYAPDGLSNGLVNRPGSFDSETHGYLIPAILVAFAVLVRVAGAKLEWFPPNFSIVGAMALFAGATLKPRWLGIAVTALTIIGSSLIMGHEFSPWLISFAYLPFVLIAFFAGYLKPQQSLPSWVGGTLMASIVFFVVSNFGVWLYAGEYYERSVNGVVACYVAAIPFFHNTLIGDFVFSAVLFGSFVMLTSAGLISKRTTEA